jgi:hypothetical protein
VVQQVRHRCGQHSIAQKLQAFVVIRAGAAVRECALQQLRVAKLVAELLLQRLQQLGQGRRLCGFSQPVTSRGPRLCT